MLFHFKWYAVLYSISMLFLSCFIFIQKINKYQSHLFSKNAVSFSCIVALQLVNVLIHVELQLNIYMRRPSLCNKKEFLECDASPDTSSDFRNLEWNFKRISLVFFLEIHYFSRSFFLVFRLAFC